MKVNLEFFCGTSGFTEVSNNFGMNCISFDSRRRKKTCEPHIKIDINNLDVSFFKGMNVFAAWFGLPCDIWSNASGGFHLTRDFKPKTDKAKNHIELYYKTFEIIDAIKPKYYFIENPRGALRHFPPLLERVKNNTLFIKETSLDSYGFATIKPTNIFTNFENLKLKPISRFGRGNKNAEDANFSNLTKVQRQKTPIKLYESILRQCT